MKKAIIGGFLALNGTLGCLAVFIVASNNMVSGWNTPPGRFLTTVSETGMTSLMVVSCIFLGIGLLILGIEYFRSDK